MSALGVQHLDFPCRALPGTLPNYDHELWGSDVAPAGAGGGKAGAITGAASSGAAPATNAKLLGKPQLHGVSDEAVMRAPGEPRAPNDQIKFNLARNFNLDRNV